MNIKFLKILLIQFFVIFLNQAFAGELKVKSGDIDSKKSINYKKAYFA